MTNKVEQAMLKAGEEKRFKRLSRIVVNSLIDNAIEKGEIDPKNKSESELDQEILDFLKSISGGKTEFLFVIDHREDLLAEAKKHVELGHNEFGCLFYAIWCEHWINALIVNLGTRIKIQEKELILIIRELSFHGKLALIPTLFGLPKLNKKHIDKMLKIAEVRNGFIHYKWQGKSEDLDNQYRGEIKKVILEMHGTVKYLKSYEARHLYHGQKKLLRKIRSPK